jgi:excisionase family DNA binding protein
MTLAVRKNVAPERLGYSQSEAAHLIGVTDRTLRKWERAGILVPGRVGRVVRYHRDEIERILQGRRN